MLTMPVLATLAALAGAPVDTVPLYTDLGDHHVPITTRVPLAQRYFDQGMRLLYAFNHGEAIRAFNEAGRVDSTCAMCFWGTAYAYGPHVNAGMDSASGVAAYTALGRALRLLRYAGPREQAFIGALAKRYAAIPRPGRAALDSAYARAMADVVKRYPNDLDAAALYAEALMDLRPWNYWIKTTGAPYPGTTEILAQLERVLAANPRHPGACHFYIHAVEAVTPEKAVPCAERLAALMPGAGHLVHMPAHIYIRVGRYGDAVTANEHAVHADEVYIEGQKPEGLYPIGYYPHNYHFLAFAATMAGRSAQAIEAARKAADATPLDVARAAPPVEVYVAYPFLALARFGRWDDVLALAPPPADLPYSLGMATYARGLALAGKARIEEAEGALEQLEALAAAEHPSYAAAGWTTPRAVLEIARQSLAGEIALLERDPEAAVAHFRQAVRLEDDLLYTEPPDWYYPARQSLGFVLLKAGLPADAEAVYREDLRRFPENGWSLFGLAQALTAQGKAAEAAEIDARFRKAWTGADVTLTTSRF